MSVDLALRATFRNFATLFLVVATVTVPLHVAHAFIFRDVYAVRDIQYDIERLDADQPVREVFRDDVENSKTAALWITVAEIALIPMLAGAARHVLHEDSRSGLPRVGRAWAKSLSAWRTPSPAPVSLAAAGVGLLVAAGAIFMADRIGSLIAEPLPDDLAFGPLGLARGAAVALGAPFFLVPLALFARKAKAEGSYADSLASPDN